MLDKDRKLEADIANVKSEIGMQNLLIYGAEAA